MRATLMSLAAWILLAVVMIAIVLLWRRAPQRAEPSDLCDDDAANEPSEVGLIEIEDAIDLHGFQPREIPRVVESYLEAAIEKGYREVRLIHGKGKGVQRRRVRELLSQHPEVEHFADAPGHRGGWGSTLAQLKVRRSK